MGKPPAVIIIARHGSRLDADNPSWIKSSPTPYDPPLSYGGWTQTRALGARIASLLRERDIAINEEEISNRRRGSQHDGFGSSSASHGSAPQKPIATLKRRKRKIIIHSSPFLRCIQSSIAISAGMMQYVGNLKKFEAAHERISARQMKRSNAPTRSLTMDSTALDAKYMNGTSQGQTQEPPSSDEDKSAPYTANIWKPTLRIDAFLGEWLSPEYFEFITSPPGSYMMVAGAKAELMRRAEEILGAKVEDDGPKTPAHEWQNGLVNGSASARKTTISFKLDDVAKALPKVKDSSINGTDRKDYGAASSVDQSRYHSLSKGYAPPVPTYAIRAMEAIPPGFVSHARDACIRLDFQWDSQREPQNWGDGGEHGEEWRSMHKRVRRGLMEMISWYKKEGPYYDPQDYNNANGAEGSSEEDEELILVLVTHGAPCNALIGALTNQPVLLDVGMGSLTMAVHKGSSSSPPPAQRRTSVSSRRRSSVDQSQSEDYVMRYTASTEHLRAGADPLRIPQLQSPYLQAIPEGRRNGGSSGSGTDGSTTPEMLDQPSVRNAALGSMRRSRAATQGAHRTLSTDSNHSSGGGLWGSSSATLMEPIETLPSRENSTHSDDYDGDDPALQATTEDLEKTISPPAPAQTHIVQSPVAHAPPAGGLWGSAQPKRAPVRRWTVVERN